MKHLEETGVIAGYVALLNPKAVGAHGTSFTIVNLETLGGNALEDFEQAVRAEPRILLLRRLDARLIGTGHAPNP